MIWKKLGMSQYPFENGPLNWRLYDFGVNSKPNFSDQPTTGDCPDSDWPLVHSAVQGGKEAKTSSIYYLMIQKVTEIPQIRTSHYDNLKSFKIPQFLARPLINTIAYL